MVIENNGPLPSLTLYKSKFIPPIVNPALLLKSIPKSTIVYGNDQTDSAIKENQELIITNYDTWLKNTRNKCYSLYKKYVAIGCEFEINIAGRTRNELIQLMDDQDTFVENTEMNETKLITMYNSSAREMYALIQGSFARFKLLGTFKKLLIEGGI